MDRGEVNHSLVASDGTLIIFAEPTVSAKPRKRAFDHPAPREHLEAVLVPITFYDLKHGVEVFLHPIDELASVGLIGPNFLNLLLGLPSQAPEKARSPVSILYVGSMNNHIKDVPDCVDDHVAFAASDALSGVVATRAACFSGLDALAVENGSSWLRFSVASSSLLSR